MIDRALRGFTLGRSYRIKSTRFFRAVAVMRPASILDRMILFVFIGLFYYCVFDLSSLFQGVY